MNRREKRASQQALSTKHQAPMPIKKPHENRPDYTALRWIRAVQDAMRGSLEGEAGAAYCRLLSEEHLLVEKWVQARSD